MTPRRAALASASPASCCRSPPSAAGSSPDRSAALRSAIRRRLAAAGCREPGFRCGATTFGGIALADRRGLPPALASDPAGRRRLPASGRVRVHLCGLSGVLRHCRARGAPPTASANPEGHYSQIWQTSSAIANQVAPGPSIAGSHFSFDEIYCLSVNFGAGRVCTSRGFRFQISHNQAY